LTARVVVPTPPFGEKKVTICRRRSRPPLGPALPVRISSASTRPRARWRRSWRDHVVGTGLEEGDARLHVAGGGDHDQWDLLAGRAANAAIAPETASPSATIRSYEPTRSALTAIGCGLDVVVT
jgi:hypothetical protein